MRLISCFLCVLSLSGLKCSSPGQDELSHGTDPHSGGTEPPPVGPIANAVYVAHDSKAVKPDGKSWVTAYPHIQEAIADVRARQVAGDHSLVVIAVKQTDYLSYRAKENDPTLAVTIKKKDVKRVVTLVDLSELDHIHLMGGFEGLKENWADRKTEFFHKTKLSGEFYITAGGKQFVLHVILAAYPAGKSPTDVLIDGFYINDGVAEADVPEPGLREMHSYGGGILLVNAGSHIVIRNSKFELNEAAFGGGIAAINSNPTITDCFFDTNLARVNTKLTRGGAIYLTTTTSVKGTEGNVTPVVFSATTINGPACIFEKNRANRGGAIAVDNASVQIDDCKFNKNAMHGLAYSEESGGGALAVESDERNKSKVVLNHTQFVENLGIPRGGAILNTKGDVAISNSTFTKNKADSSVDSKGGAIYVGELKNYDTEHDGLLRLQNVTFTQNEARLGGAIANYSADVIAVQCVFQQNGSKKTTFGGALYARGGSYSKNALVDLQQTTFDANIAVQGGALFLDENATLTALIADSILFKNNLGKEKDSASFNGIYSEPGTYGFDPK